MNYQRTHSGAGVPDREFHYFVLERADLRALRKSSLSGEIIPFGQADIPRTVSFSLSRLPDSRPARVDWYPQLTLPLEASEERNTLNPRDATHFQIFVSRKGIAKSREAGGLALNLSKNFRLRLKSVG